MNPSPPEKGGGPSPEAAPHQTHATGNLQHPGLSFKETSWYFKVHPKTISRWVHAGKLKTVTLPSGRKVVIVEAAK